MTELTYENFLVQLANEVDRLTNHFVFDGYNALVSLLKAPLASMIVLYIILTGYAIVRGIIQKPQQELFKFSIKVGLIYMAGMNWEWFASHIRDLLVIGSESIASTLMQAVHKQSTHSSVNQGLQNVLNEILKLGITLFHAGSLRKLTPYFAGMMVLISGTITIGFAFIEIIVAKLMLAVTLCTAPLFIIFTLFDQTKSFFERWLGVLIGFAFVLIFVSSVVGLCVHLLHWVTNALLANEDQFIAVIWIPIFIVSSLCTMGIIQAASIGKSIGGSFCTSHGASMVSGFISGGIGALGLTQNLKNLSLGGLRRTTRFVKKGLDVGATSHNMFKQLHKNLRKGAS